MDLIPMLAHDRLVQDVRSNTLLINMPTLFVVILLGGVGGTLVLAGMVAAVAGVVDAFVELPPWVQT